MLTGVVLPVLASIVAFLDFRRILELSTEAGFFAATEIGLYVTLIGALLALVGFISRIYQLRNPALLVSRITQDGAYTPSEYRNPAR